MWLWGYAPLLEFPAGFSEREYQAVLRCDPCAYCGALSETLDHVQARSRGGADGWENLAGACKSCNSSKGPRPLLFALLGPGSYPSCSSVVRTVSIPVELADRLRYVSRVIGVPQTRIIIRACEADLGDQESIDMIARWHAMYPEAFPDASLT